MISNNVANLNIDDCKLHYDGLLEQYTRRAGRCFFISITCFILAITAFLMDSMEIGATLLIVAICLRLESISSEVSGNSVVAVYPLILLFNHYGCQENQMNNKSSNSNE